jgi:haloacetate dehalogenase
VEVEVTSHPESEDNGISRRNLVQAVAAGAAAASIAVPALAQSTATVAEATAADYARDPTRWGSAEVAGLFPGFKHVDMRTKGAIIRLRHGGSGPPLLLLHGYPNNHVLWHAVAAKLAQRYHVVCPDLRGYGDSSLPDPGPRLANYSHRVQGEEMIEVMEQLGHRQFHLIGHDRGARISHRMALDHPERLMKLCLLDMLPTYYVWTNTSREWALGTWHWAFLAQPEPFPQTMIDAVSPEWFLTNRGGIPKGRPKIVMDEFIRCFTPKTISGCCRDYRAGATINFEMDQADKDKQVTTPLLVLWGTRGGPAGTEYPTVWRKYAKNLVTIEPLATGHYIQEEMPEACLDHFNKFFTA